MSDKEIINITNKNLLQPILQFLEVIVDGQIDDTLLKKAPVVNLIFGCYKTFRDIKDYNYKNKILNFFKGFLDNTVTEEEINIHLEEINKDSKSFKQIQQYILEYIEMNTSNQNLRFGLIYNAFYNKKITKESFFELTEINNRLLEPDLRLLLEVFNYNQSRFLDYRADRLVALGLLRKETGILDSYSEELNQDSYTLTDLGKIFGSILHEHYKVEKENEDLSDLF